MCVPDLKGSQGTFCLCTTRVSDDKFREGGVRFHGPQERRLSFLYSGPDNPLIEKGGELRADLKFARLESEVGSLCFGPESLR